MRGSGDTPKQINLSGYVDSCHIEYGKPQGPVETNKGQTVALQAVTESPFSGGENGPEEDPGVPLGVGLGPALCVYMWVRNGLCPFPNFGWEFFGLFWQFQTGPQSAGMAPWARSPIQPVSGQPGRHQPAS